MPAGMIGYKTFTIHTEFVLVVLHLKVPETQMLNIYHTDWLPGPQSLSSNTLTHPYVWMDEYKLSDGHQKKYYIQSKRLEQTILLGLPLKISLLLLEMRRSEQSIVLRHPRQACIS